MLEFQERAVPVPLLPRVLYSHLWLCVTRGVLNLHRCEEYTSIGVYTGVLLFGRGPSMLPK